MNTSLVKENNLQQIDMWEKKLFCSQSGWPKGQFKKKWTQSPRLYTVKDPNHKTEKEIHYLTLSWGRPWSYRNQCQRLLYMKTLYTDKN